MNIKSRMKSTRYFVARHAIIKAKLCTDVGESFPVCRGDKGRTSTRRLRFILDKKRSYKAIRAACASESRNSQLFTKNFKVNTKSLGFERAHRNGFVNIYVRKKIFSLDWHVLEGRSKVKLWLVMLVAVQTGGN